MKIHRLNETGIERMSSYLESLESDEPQTFPVNLLTDPSYATEVNEAGDVAMAVFPSRMEMSKHLYEQGLLSQVPGVERDRGLWCWLALYYFEQLCPLNADKKRVPGELARWIPQLDNSFRYYRHLVAGPFLIYLAHHDNPARTSVLLMGPVNKPGEMLGQFASRMEFVTNPVILEVASSLYVDAAATRLKRGANSKTNGGARRLAKVLMQFDVTWDLRTTTSAQLMSMLPIEFNKFRVPATSK